MHNGLECPIRCWNWTSKWKILICKHVVVNRVSNLHFFLFSYYFRQGWMHVTPSNKKYRSSMPYIHMFFLILTFVSCKHRRDIPQRLILKWWKWCSHRQCLLDIKVYIHTMINRFWLRSGNPRNAWTQLWNSVLEGKGQNFDWINASQLNRKFAMIILIEPDLHWCQHFQQDKMWHM